MSQIKIINLTKSFTKKSSHYALDHICLDISKGEIFGIIGMSGAGKSTLMRCLTGLEKPDQGEIIINGEEITKKSKSELIPFRQKFGMVFQHFNLFSSRTVSENIAYPMELFGIPKSRQAERIKELLQLVGLTGKENTYPALLSGGEKQRVGIARALANNPEILFCDEATSALDPKTTQSILDLMLELNQKLGLTIVVITHQLEVIKKICSRVAVLSKGKLVEEGEITQIFTHPKHEVTKHLVYSAIDRIPKDLLDKLSAGNTLVLLNFEGEYAEKPLVSKMIKKFEVEVNFLQGSLDAIKTTIIGNLLVEFSGQKEEIAKAIQFLKEHHVNCEVLHE